MWWRNGRRSGRRLVADLVTETEAFLRGRYVDRLHARGIVPPVWAWTNLLAHGSEEDLRHAAARCGGGTRTGWEAAQADLASDLLTLVRPSRSLADLQREVLVPLELRLADRRSVAGWDWRTWASVLHAALAEQRRTHLT